MQLNTGTTSTFTLVVFPYYISEVSKQYYETDHTSKLFHKGPVWWLLNSRSVPVIQFPNTAMEEPTEAT